VREPTNEVEVEREAKVTVSDGTVLLAHIYHPVGVGAVPTIVERTPYGRTNLNAGMAWYLSRAGPDGAYGSFLAYSDLIADGRASDPEVWDHHL
jgi:predicted acyl esterase